jgi:hypothetical protein
MREASLVVIALSGACFAGCTVLPGLNEATGGIPVYDIVLRTKCELSDAFTDDEGRWLVGNPIHPKFAWLENWTAQVDLTLQILDQATFAPGATFTQPFHNAYPTSVGPSSSSTSGVPGTTIAGVSQSFAVAAGVSLNGQAQRTQTMTYVFSVKELKEWRARPDTQQLCVISDQMDLRGKLGLKEWFGQAVWPVASEYELLYAGYHEKPTVTPQPGPKATPTAVPTAAPLADHACTPNDIQQAQRDLDSAQQIINDALISRTETEKPLATLTNNATAAQTDITKAKKTIVTDQAQYGAVLDPALSKKLLSTNSNIIDARKYLYAAKVSLTNAEEELKQLTAGRNTALTKANEAIKSAKGTMTNSDCTAVDLRNKVDLATALADTVYKNADAAKANVAVANEHLKKMQSSLETAQQFTAKTIDPPIATIGQSVQFILAYGGNITPTWTFVRFKGPNNPLFSSSGTRTHTLNITLGPTVPGTGTPNSDVKTNQFYLQINSLLAPLVP